MLQSGQLCQPCPLHHFGTFHGLDSRHLPSPSPLPNDSDAKKGLSFVNISSQTKLDDLQYVDMSSLESDLKRMVQNAKDFNVTGSKIFEDAERLRKAVTNFMVKHNPAYKDRGYHPQPTAIPSENEDESIDAEPVNLLEKENTPPTIRLIVNGASKPKSESEPPEEMPAAEPVDMRQEQLKIIEEMIELRDPEFVPRSFLMVRNRRSLTRRRDANTEITLEFFEKPPKREYPDYYRLITHPTALKDIQKAVSTKKISSWEAFITEIEYLWENAREYNEEGSFIHNNANKLRVRSVPCPWLRHASHMRSRIGV
jgi:hypothetical protein